GEHTPIQWSSSNNACFSQGVTPWLPVDTDYTTKNLTSEIVDPNAVLNWYRQLTKLRRDDAAFYQGDYIPLDENNPSVMSYLRKSKDDAALVVLNFSSESQTVALDTAKIDAVRERALASTNPATRSVDLNKIPVEPW